MYLWIFGSYCVFFTSDIQKFSGATFHRGITVTILLTDIKMSLRLVLPDVQKHSKWADRPRCSVNFCCLCCSFHSSGKTLQSHCPHAFPRKAEGNFISGSAWRAGMYFLSLKNEKEVIFILFVWLLIISSYFFMGSKERLLTATSALGLKKMAVLFWGQ